MEPPAAAVTKNASSRNANIIASLSDCGLYGSIEQVRSPLRRMQGLEATPCPSPALGALFQCILRRRSCVLSHCSHFRATRSMARLSTEQVRMTRSRSIS